MTPGDLAAVRRVVEIENTLWDVQTLAARLALLTREHAELEAQRPALETERITLLKKLQGTTTAATPESSPPATTATTPYVPRPGTMPARILGVLPRKWTARAEILKALGVTTKGDDGHVSVALWGLEKRGLVERGSKGIWRRSVGFPHV